MLKNREFLLIISHHKDHQDFKIWILIMSVSFPRLFANVNRYKDFKISTGLMNASCPLLAVKDLQLSHRQR